MHVATRSESRHPAYHLELMGSTLFLPFTHGLCNFALEGDGWCIRVSAKQDVHIHQFLGMLRNLQYIFRETFHCFLRRKRVI